MRTEFLCQDSGQEVRTVPAQAAECSFSRVAVWPSLNFLQIMNDTVLADAHCPASSAKLSSVPFLHIPPLPRSAPHSVYSFDCLGSFQPILHSAEPRHDSRLTDWG